MFKDIEQQEQFFLELVGLKDLFDKVPLTQTQKVTRRKKLKLPPNKSSGCKLLDTVQHLRVCIKYNLLEIESLTRELKQYKKLLDDK